MKKIYVKPQTSVVATAPCELCSHSFVWNVDNAKETEEFETTTNWGDVIYDKNQWTGKKDEDPFDSDNW